MENMSEATSPVSGSVSNSGSHTSASKDASMRTNARRRQPSVSGRDTKRIFFSLFPELEYISSRPVTGFSLSCPLYSGLEGLCTLKKATLVLRTWEVFDGVSQMCPS